MLSILKNNIFGSALTSAGNVQQKEIDWYLSNYWTIASQASVLLGFSSQGLGSITQTLRPFYLLGTVQLTLQTISLMSELYVVVVATIVSIWAPALSLRGVNGFESMRKSVQILGSLLNGMTATWLLGLFSFVMSSFISTLASSKTEKTINQSIILTSLSILILIAMTLNALRLFYCNRTRQASIDLLHTAEGIGDLDNNSDHRFNRDVPGLLGGLFRRRLDMNFDGTANED